MNLVDILVIWNKFTWFKSNGSCRSRIDRFLLTEGLISKWNVNVQRVGDRDISDHRPIWIQNIKVNWGPKPFKVFKCWFNHPTFDEFVASTWNNFHIVGSPLFILAEKLEKLGEWLR
ncbi:unnamed protein product [Lathyrus sativus]|nr:unnamed protein product [Lathyrus sativus]